MNGNVYNIGSTMRVTIEDLARRIIERTGSSSPIKFIPYEEVYGEGYEDMRHREPCLKRIQAAIGYAPKTSLDEIIDSVIAYIRPRIQQESTRNRPANP